MMATLALAVTFAAPLSAGDRDRTAPPQIRPLSSDTVSAAPRAVVPPGVYDLSIAGDFELGGFIFKDGYPFLHTDEPSTLSTALGLNALVSSTPGVPYAYSGTNNVAFGAYTLNATTQGFRNSALGNFALASNTVGATNTAVGYAALVSNTTGVSNTAVGTRALAENTTGIWSTAIGAYALANNTIYGQNTATGAFALNANTTGTGNTATGESALLRNTTGSFNTALGTTAMNANLTGYDNTALGGGALANSTDADGNTAVGTAALVANTGEFNTALGWRAGYEATTGSNNIFIGNVGAAADSGVIVIGNTSNTTTFVEGIFGVTGSGAQVVVDSNNQLATLTSSRRFKEQIQNMGDTSAQLEQLRPVTFLYTAEAAGEGARPVEFGLIAEEVAEIYPDLVIYDESGEPYSVRYHLLTPMLLNEVQKLQREITTLKRHGEELGQLRARLELLEAAEAEGHSGGL